MTMAYTDNSPNAAKLITSLRNTGYDSYTAIMDLIDNSIDAGASTAIIKTSRVNSSIAIVDNGSGMDFSKLDQAMRLGSDSDKNEDSDLGKFGMGLCTASISMGRRLEVFTKTKDGEILYALQDIDDVVKYNKFIKDIREANPLEQSIFNKTGLNHGTIIKITKIDNLSNTNHTIFNNILRKKVGQVFRKFIDAGIVIRLNSDSVEAIDPLNIKGVRVHSNESFIYKIDGINHKIGLKVAMLPRCTDSESRELGITQRGQGIYVLRNQREIAHSSKWLGVVKQHPHLNRIRVELEFNSILDVELGVKYNKDGVTPNQSFKTWLREQLEQQIKTLERLAKMEANSSKEKKVEHKSAIESIKRKSKLLVTPREPRDIELKLKDSVDAEVGKEVNVKYITENLSDKGPVFEVGKRGSETQIIWNAEHPFYEKVILANSGNINLIEAIDHLIYSMASAELSNIDNDAIKVIDNYKQIMSMNLRNLLI